MFLSSKRPNLFEMPLLSEKRQQTATNWATKAELPPQSGPVGQQPTLPSFAELIKNMPVPHVDHLQRPSEGTPLPRPLLRQDVPSLCIQQSSQRVPAASNFQGSIPSVTATSLADLERVAQDLTSSSGPSPTLQSACDAPAVGLSQTPTPAAPKHPASASQRPRRRPKHVDPKTGEKVAEGTPGAITAANFWHRKLVDPKTGKQASKETENPIKLSTFNSRKLVDPETGKPASEDTEDPIKLSTFNHHKLVDPKTGKPASEDTVDPIKLSTFNHHKLVDPKTGKPASEDTENPIRFSTFNNRKLVDPKTGKPATKDTEDPIKLSTFRNRKLVDPKTGKPASKDTEGPIFATTFNKRKKKTKN
jgi:hypothetical protein